MSDARTVIARTSIDRVWCDQERRSVPVFIGVEGADAILAALAEAGLEIISTAERTALQQFVVKIARGSE